ncbi:Hsp70 family protein [Herbiconiux sp. SYSU D00978]|uniref:Hsp70 family protein n=1 Tax=Herbiconiux sp. SYSU D00978 TaxID=2812562 RepID=UPI001A972EB7|nr:Hsp70 family protein [Herbiconiux sp. SYSU D00978]
MTYALGVDVGTSFTAAAITRRDEVPRTLTLGQRGDAVPTVIHLDADGEIRVGEAAERRGVTEPERVIREFKRRIGDSVPILAGDLEITPQDAFASMARWVVDRAEEREGEPPASVTITHPAGWGDYKLGLVRDALAGVGLADAALLPEPEAAALHYAAQERVPEGSCIGVYDLGAGTFDVALLRKAEGDAFVPVGRPDGLEHVGGADFDDAVLRHVVQSMPDAFAGLDTEDTDVRVALARLRRECTEAKEALSFDSEAAIPVVLPGTHGQVRLVRAEFEAMIADEVRRTIDAFARVVNAAGLRYDELGVILLIGGSSRIPLIAELLSAEFGRPVAVDADPKSAICLGAAASAALTAFAAAATDDENEDPSALAALGLAGAAAPAAAAPSALHRIGSPAVLTIAAVVVAAVALGGPAASMFSLFDPASDSGGGASAASAAGAEPAAAALPAPGEAADGGGGGADAPPTPLKPGARNADDQDDGFSPLRGPSPRPAAAKEQPEKGTSPSPAPGGSTPTPATANDPSPDPTQTPSSDPSTTPTTDPTPDPTVDPTPGPTTDPTPDPTTDPTPDPTTDPTPTPDPTTDFAPEPAPDPTTPAPEPEPSPSATSDPPADQPAPTESPAATS